MYKGNTSVEMRRPQKSLFDLSHQKRLSTRMGRLTPILCLEAIPGDKFTGSSEVLVRLAPLLAPIYDSLILYVHYFFVPNRLLWEEWETFITGGRLGVGIEPTLEPIPPFFQIEDYMTDGFNQKSLLGDYLGVPQFPGGSPAAYAGLTIDAMPFIGYQKIWMDYYRDRNYVADDQVVIPAPSGELAPADYYAEIRVRDYMKDYFTAALPFTQRGTEVLMPLAGNGTVTYLDRSIIRNEAGAVVTDGHLDAKVDAGESYLYHDLGTGTQAYAQLHNIDEVNLTSSSVSINDLRSAVRLQEWLERNAVGGSRYTESIQAHFAVRPQDSRLQRAEFLGGGRIPIKISEVVTTAFSENEAAEVIPAGNLQGHGVTYGNTNNFSFFAPEHGFIYGIASIMVKASYYQGMPRMFKRRSFLDYPWPSFAKLGEQRVEKWEIYANAATLTEDGEGKTPLFGYASRYADWKQCHSTNHGEFRDTLLFWTLTRVFASPPTLGEFFCNFDDASQNGIFAVNGSSDNFWLYVHNQVKVVRSLPYFGTPTL